MHLQVGAELLHSLTLVRPQFELVRLESLVHLVFRVGEVGEIFGLDLGHYCVDVGERHGFLGSQFIRHAYTGANGQQRSLQPVTAFHKIRIRSESKIRN